MALNLSLINEVNFSSNIALGDYNCTILSLLETKTNNEDTLTLTIEIPEYGQQAIVFKTVGSLQFQMRGILEQLNIKKAGIGEFITIVNSNPKMKVRYTQQLLEDTQNPGKKFEYKSFDFNLSSAVTTPPSPQEDPAANTLRD